MSSLSLPTFFTKYGALISARGCGLRTRQNVGNDKDVVLSHVFRSRGCATRPCRKTCNPGSIRTSWLSARLSLLLRSRATTARTLRLRRRHKLTPRRTICMAKKSTRREFIVQATAGAAALSAGGSLISAKAEDPFEEMINARQAPATGRVLGANDRVNFGFIGMGGRMGEHTSYIANRQKNQGDVQAVAVCDIYEKNKRRGQAQTKVSDKDIHHDYRELCARKDVDAVVIATPDHWHARHATEALNGGKHVYLEKPMTYTIEEARDLARKVKATGLQLHVGSQHQSDIQHWKAREVIQSGLIGKVLWASTSYSRNTPIGEWNYYRIDPDEEANERTIDWKAFLGYAKKRPFDKDRFFRWRKYWDYSGGIATDLFYHRLSPLMFSIGSPEFPARVTAQGGIFAPVEGDIREVPDTYFTTIEFPGKYAVMLGSSMLNATGIPE